MLIISGQLKVDAAARDGYVAECEDVVRQARAAAGCLDFAITTDTLEADRINIYERWNSDEELSTFRGSGPSSDQQAQILEASVHKYRISGVEEP